MAIDALTVRCCYGRPEVQWRLHALYQKSSAMLQLKFALVVRFPGALPLAFTPKDQTFNFFVVAEITRCVGSLDTDKELPRRFKQKLGF